MLDYFFEGSLILTSIVAVAFIIERGLALRWKGVVPAQVEMAVDAFRNQADLPIIRAACEQNPSALSRLLLVIISHLRLPRGEALDALEKRLTGLAGDSVWAVRNRRTATTVAEHAG